MSSYTERYNYHAPDPEKMKAAIAKIPMKKRELLVILLAYYAGLTTGEMQELKAADISDDYSFLIAPDRRKIPLIPILAEALKSLFGPNKSPDMPILLNERGGEKVHRVYTSKITKEFMEFAGLSDVHLKDLRTACVINWMQKYPWEYVSQISGLNLAFLINGYQNYLPEGSVRPKLEPVNHTEITPEKIKAIFQTHKDDLFGLILRLQVVHQLSPLDICGLTWDMVDDEMDTIRLPGRSILITDDLRNCLYAAKAYSSTNWILAFPNSKTPYTSDAISHLMSKVLLAEGYAGITVKKLIGAAEYLRCKEIVEDLLKKENYFSGEDFVTASGLSLQRARNQLYELEAGGVLNRIGIRFYSAEKTVHPTQFQEVARKLTKSCGGSFTCVCFADAVGIDARSAATQLRRMIAEGKIERVSHHGYACSM